MFWEHLQKLNIFDHLAPYRPLLRRWKDHGLEVSDTKMKAGFFDPVAFRIQVKAHFSDLDREMSGYGEDESEVLAFEKAICEMHERERLLYEKPTLGKRTSNGIAAHRFKALAKHAARNELIERDAFLRHWVTKTPLHLQTMPDEPILKRFAESISDSGHELFLCRTTLGLEQPSVAIIRNMSTGGFLVGSSLKSSRYEADLKAVREAFFSLAGDFERDHSGPVDWENPTLSAHRELWYERNTMPKWMLSSEIFNLKSPFNRKVKFDYEDISSTVIPVISCTSDAILDLWLGPTPAQVVESMLSLYGVEVNRNPHPFP